MINVGERGVLLMGYGSPRSMDEIEVYFTSIRRGSGPSQTELEELKRRYDAIGGISPLNSITANQVVLLQKSLEVAGSDTRIYLGMKHSEPLIRDVARAIKSDGITELLCLPLAPFYSKIGTETYFDAVRESEIANAVSVQYVKSWNKEEGLVKCWSRSIWAAAMGFNASGFRLIFTAHSLPITAADNLDTYRNQLGETAKLAADTLGVGEWDLVFQSAGMRGRTWIGPSIYDHMAELQSKGQSSFLVAPIGFIADNLETLYDAGIRCREWAAKSGASVITAAAPNDSKELIAALHSVVRKNGFE